jgi:hypothetical protein
MLLSNHEGGAGRAFAIPVSRALVESGQDRVESES